MIEEWRDIKGYEKLYQVSNLGRVKSLPKFHRTSKFYSSIGYMSKEKILKPLKQSCNYLQVDLCDINGKRRKKYIHKLVAEAFIDNPNNLPQVNHKDGNKLNNSVDNLEWCTCKENILHGIKNGLKIYKKGTQNAMYGKYVKSSNRAIPILQFDLNNNFIKQRDSQIEIQRELGYKQSVISNCCNGRGKTAYGYIWKHKVKENK